MYDSVYWSDIDLNHQEYYKQNLNSVMFAVSVVFQNHGVHANLKTLICRKMDWAYWLSDITSKHSIPTTVLELLAPEMEELK